jgi:hypothetical protein
MAAAFQSDQLYSEIIDWINSLAETYGVTYAEVLFALERDAEDGRFDRAALLAQALRGEA